MSLLHLGCGSWGCRRVPPTTCSLCPLLLRQKCFAVAEHYTAFQINLSGTAQSRVKGVWVILLRRRQTLMSPPLLSCLSKREGRDFRVLPSEV